VKTFLEALVDAPRALWHPALVVLDEAHIFCPEKDRAESAPAVIDLMTRGRKRGFCGVLATQRLAKLNKDAAAEANNKLVGRSALDVDMKRAADELGFSSRDEQLRLRTLPDGNFYAFGPALSSAVVQVHVGGVTTSHHRAGQASAPAPPPREKVRQVLEQLADLPRQADEEIRSLAAAKTRITELERQLKAAARSSAAAPPPAKPVVEVRIVARDVPMLKGPALAALTRAVDQGQALGLRLEELGDRVHAAATDIAGQLRHAIEAYDRYADQVEQLEEGRSSPTKREIHEANAARVAPSARADGARSGQPEAAAGADDLDAGGALERVLVAIARYPDGMEPRKLAILAGIKRGGSTWRGALARARNEGLLERGSLKLTELGRERFAGVRPMPEGPELRKYWLRKLGGSAAARVLDVLCKAYPQELQPEDLASRAGLGVVGGSTWRGAFAKLRGLDLVPRGELRASAELFEVRPE
jgi:hypothetical protein